MPQALYLEPVGIANCDAMTTNHVGSSVVLNNAVGRVRV